MGGKVYVLLLKFMCSMDVYIGFVFVDMYVKCGEVECVRMVFDAMIERNRVIWNSLIICYE